MIEQYDYGSLSGMERDHIKQIVNKGELK